MFEHSMKNLFNQTEIYKTDHTKFGGLICLSDFNTERRGKYPADGSPIAARILRDQKFDLQCRKNKENTAAKE